MAQIEERKIAQNIEKFKCKIDKIKLFKICLDSVIFQKSQSKSDLMDVAFLLYNNGMVFKSASYSGTVMTKCLIKDSFF